jgi:hypothetical protein
MHMNTGENCTYKVLHHNADGYIVRCNQCNSISVGYGTTSIAFTWEQFYEFKSLVTEYYEAFKHNTNPNLKQVEIATAARSIKLLYSVNELAGMLELMEEAHASLAVEQLMMK